MTVRELRGLLFDIEEQDKEITLDDVKKMMDEWNKLQDLKKYEKLLDKIGYQKLLNHPLKEQLKACTDLHEKVVLLEKIYSEKNI